MTAHDDRRDPNGAQGFDPAHEFDGASGLDSTTGLSSGHLGSGDLGSGGQDATRDVAKGEAESVAKDAKDTAAGVAANAKDQAATVVEEAKSQARKLFDDSKGELSQQASGQQARAASGLSALAGELHTMAERSDGGLATDLARDIAGRAESAAQFLQDREPGDVLAEVQRFARRKPGTFLALAAAAGFLGGRLTRGMTADDDTDTTALRAYGGTRPSGTDPYPGEYSPAGGYGMGAPMAASGTMPAMGQTVPTTPEAAQYADDAPLSESGRFGGEVDRFDDAPYDRERGGL